MATSDDARSLDARLCASDWSIVLGAVEEAGRLLRSAAPGDPGVPRVVEALVRLAGHQKWEVRRAVANIAAATVNPSFEGALARFVSDDNALVRQAARRAAIRRRDWQNASAFGKQHELRINATLDDIEVRFGVRGREAVKRASEQIADTFARELYHEVIKLIAPIANSAERLKSKLANPEGAEAILAREAESIERRVTHLKAVLDSMRAYTAPANSRFAVDDVVEAVNEALGIAQAGRSDALLPQVICGDGPHHAEVCRPRLVQALTNVLANAAEAYGSISDPKPVCVRVAGAEGRVDIIIEDFGCGMSEESLADAVVLFATNKPGGTGFGLPLAIKIIESEHAGRLTIESAKGRGTLVRIALSTRHLGDAP